MLLAGTLEVAAGPFPASEWQYRSSITLNNASGTKTLNEFPVLVRLDVTGGGGATSSAGYFDLEK